MRPIRSALNRIHHPAILAAGLVLAVAIPVEMGVYSSQNLLSWSTIRISLLVAVLCAMLGAAPVWAACLLFAVSGYALLWLFSPLTTIMIAALTSIAVLSFASNPALEPLPHWRPSPPSPRTTCRTTSPRRTS